MAKDKRPSRIKLGCYTITIKFVKPPVEGLIGRAEIDNSIIYVSPAISPQRQRDTLLHEVIHFAASFPNDKSDLSEDVVNSLAPVLLMIFRENPKLVDYLMEKG